MSMFRVGSGELHRKISRLAEAFQRIHKGAAIQGAGCKRGYTAGSEKDQY